MNSSCKCDKNVFFTECGLVDEIDSLGDCDVMDIYPAITSDCGNDCEMNDCDFEDIYPASEKYNKSTDICRSYSKLLYTYSGTCDLTPR